MKTTIKILACFCILLLSSGVVSQVMPLFPGTDSAFPGSASEKKIQYYKMTIRNAPSFTLQLSGSYDYGVYELAANDNGDFSSEEFTNGENFGVRHGIGANLVAKIPLHKEGNIRLNISGSFNSFNSKYSKANVRTGNLAEFVKYNVFSGGIGIENNFTPSFKFKTLVGAGLLASVISGNANLNLDPANPSNGVTSLKIVPAFRLGITLFSGFEYQLNDNFGFNFGFQFTHANLWFKSSKSSNSSSEIYLDDARVNTRIPFCGFKQFAYGSFFGGVNIYFGINKKEYVYRKF